MIAKNKYTSNTTEIANEIVDPKVRQKNHINQIALKLRK